MDRKTVCVIMAGVIAITLTACNKPEKGPVTVTKTIKVPVTIPSQVVPQPRPPKLTGTP